MMSRVPIERRSELQLKLDILKTVKENDELYTSEIARKANVNWDSLTVYLKFFVGAGLLQSYPEGGRTLYRLTKHGLEIIGDWEVVSKNLGEDYR